MRLVHRMVADEFTPNVLGKPEVNHINGNKLDNRVCNLEWVTSEENETHALKNGLIKRTQVISIHKVTGDRMTYFSMSEASRITGEHFYGIRDTIRGKQKSTPNYFWFAM